MKKIIVAAALVAAMVLPVSAADMATSEEVGPAKVPAICYFLPLLPDCVTAWKERADEAKAKMDEMMAK